MLFDLQFGHTMSLINNKGDETIRLLHLQLNVSTLIESNFLVYRRVESLLRNRHLLPKDPCRYHH